MCSGFEKKKEHANGHVGNIWDGLVVLVFGILGLDKHLIQEVYISCMVLFTSERLRGECCC